MRGAIDQNRVSIAVVVLVIVLAVSFWLHHEATKPFYKVASPYPASEQKRFGGLCAHAAIGWTSNDKGYNPLSYCRCVLDHLQANVTADELKSAIGITGNGGLIPSGMINDPYTTKAFPDCARRLNLRITPNPG